MPNNVVSFSGVTGSAYDVYIESSGMYWNGTAFAAIGNAAWTTFAQAMTERETTGVYNYTIPPSLPASFSYGFIVRKRASSGSPAATTDLYQGGADFSWDGTDLGKVLSSSFAAGATLPRVTLVDTITTYTGNTPQTGDSYARIGANGAGLTLVSVSPTGLNAVIAEEAAGDAPEINLREAIGLILDAACFGVLSGVGGVTPVVISNPGGTEIRATITADAVGNRTLIEIENLP